MRRSLLVIYLIHSVIICLSQTKSDEVDLLTINGNEAAVNAASRLVENVGGKEVWEMTSLTVYEKAFLKNGNVVDLKITRDLEKATRKIESRTKTSFSVEIIEENSGCTRNNDEVNEMSGDILAMERQGLSQSPYYIYHRLAKEDSTLRVELVEDGNRLNVFQGEDQLLCWFLLDDLGQQYSWGNIYNGKINQHFYGPYIQLGQSRFPAWGSSMDGRFRFEYVMAEFKNESPELNCDGY